MSRAAYFPTQWQKIQRALLAQLIMICTLKQALSQDEMKKLLAMTASPDSNLNADQALEIQYRAFCTTQLAVWNLIATRRTQTSPCKQPGSCSQQILCGEKIEQLAGG
jgi:hypothetical protein